MTGGAALLQPADPQQRPHIAALLHSAGLPTADLPPDHPADFIVAVDDGRVVGAVGLERHGGAGLLRSLVVAPGHRRRGLGGALVDAIGAHARSLGLASLTLLTQTAAAFFAARGYAVIARSQAPASVQASAEFTTPCPAGSTCMTRNLQTPSPP
jgi:amino-acid N-acetyltransferase